MTIERHARQVEMLGLGAILVVYLALAAQYAWRTPAWQVPDEPAHYNVIRQIAQTGRLPRLEPGDYDQDYLGRLTAERFPSTLPLDGVQYQDYQPPLYYLLAAPVFLAFGGALLPLRLFSVLLGAGVIVLAWRAVGEVAGPGTAVLAAGFIAFIPQHLAMLAGVNNDALAELLIALGLWLALRAHTRPGTVPPWVLGLVLGAAFLTKVQAYVLAPVLAVSLLLQWWGGGRVLRQAVVVFGLGLALGALYWGRNWLVCGPWDAVCGNWHNQVVLGQPTTREWIARHGWWGSPDSLLNRFLTFTFDSFWGVFGWMGVFMDHRIYQGLLAFSAALGIGVLGAARGCLTLKRARREAVGLLALSGLTTLALYLYYNLGFVQHQGRYLFPALIPLGAAAAFGLRQWGRWLGGLPGLGRLASHLPALVGAAALAMLAALDLLALYRFILPALG